MKTIRLIPPSVIENVYANLLDQIVSAYGADGVRFPITNNGILYAPEDSREACIMAAYQHHKDRLTSMVVADYVKYLYDNELYAAEPVRYDDSNDSYTPITKLLKAG